MAAEYLAVLVVLVTVTTSAVHASAPMCYSTDSSGQQKRIYTLGHGHDWGAYEYINEGGVVTGFTLDLIAEVCTAAEIDCRTVWSPYTDCVQSLAGQHSRGGPALLDRWFDACTGWAATVTRSAFFKFSQSFLAMNTASFYIKSGNSFNVNNLGNYKIGFMDGWADDETCVARQYNKVLPVNQIIHYATTEELKDAVAKGEVDAAFVEDGLYTKYTAKGTQIDPPLEKVAGTTKSCVLRGNSMMSRKDSDFPAKWNEGFGKLVSSGRFQKLCQEAEKKHNADGKGQIKCV